jgi:hypothetical protein
MPLNLFTRQVVTLQVRNRLIGGVPSDPKLIEGWVKANMPDATEEERAKLAAKTLAELPEVVAEKSAGMHTTFKRDNVGLYIEGRQLKALFKEASNILRETLLKDAKKRENKVDEKRFTNLRSKVAERLFVEDDRIYMYRQGVVLVKPDGSEERAIHVMTAQGPRTALKKVDFVVKPELSFYVRYLEADGIVDEELIRTLLDFGGWNGLGADRSQGNGLFDVREIRLARADEFPVSRAA